MLKIIGVFYTNSLLVSTFDKIVSVFETYEEV